MQRTHSGPFLEEVFRREQGSDSGWVGLPEMEEVPGQAGMAHGGTVPVGRSSGAQIGNKGYQGCGSAESAPALSLSLPTEERRTLGDRIGKFHSWLL